MTLRETIDKYDLNVRVVVFDKGRKLYYYEIYSDESLAREVTEVKEISKELVEIYLK